MLKEHQANQPIPDKNDNLESAPTIEGKVTEKKVTEEKVTEEKVTEKKVTEKKVTEEKVTKEKTKSKGIFSTVKSLFSKK